MQLATSQRPHPPPVPPRPSRQVVAEALKRSPRPPCPTRQAPPPPNTRPWRSNQQATQPQQQVDPAPGGRTIVYESIKEDCKDEQARNTVDRNVENNRSENSGKIAPHDICTNTNSGKLYPTGNIPANVVRKRNSLTEDQRPQHRLETRKNSRGKDPIDLSDYRGRCRGSTGKDQQKENNVVAATERVEETLTMRLPAATRCPINVSLEDGHHFSFSSPDSADRQVTVSHPEKCNGSSEREADDEQVGTTPTCRSCPVEQQQQKQHRERLKGKAAENDDAEAVSSIEKSTSVPSVDRAATTVLVMDESERKIALSDHEDNNDDDNDGDNNIHRQDWLEAGVRYSSTQITLHGDDIVDGDHINGYDHHEEERITDLDFIR